MKTAEGRYEETWNSYLELLNKDPRASLKVLLVQKGEEEENLLILLWRNTGCFCLINGKKTAKLAS